MSLAAIFAELKRREAVASQMEFGHERAVEFAYMLGMQAAAECVARGTMSWLKPHEPGEQQYTGLTLIVGGKDE